DRGLFEVDQVPFAVLDPHVKRQSRTSMKIHHAPALQGVHFSHLLSLNRQNSISCSQPRASSWGITNNTCHPNAVSSTGLIVESNSEQAVSRLCMQSHTCATITPDLVVSTVTNSWQITDAR